MGFLRLPRPVVSTEAAEAWQTVAGAGAPRVCVMAPPRSWSPAAAGAGALAKGPEVGADGGAGGGLTADSGQSCSAAGPGGGGGQIAGGPGGNKAAGTRHPRNKLARRIRVEPVAATSDSLVAAVGAGATSAAAVAAVDLNQRRRRRGRRGRLVVHGAGRDRCRASARGQQRRRFGDDFVVALNRSDHLRATIRVRVDAPRGGARCTAARARVHA